MRTRVRVIVRLRSVRPPPGAQLRNQLCGGGRR